MKTIFGILVGLGVGLLLGIHTFQKFKPRKSRTLRELSPIYEQLIHGSQRPYMAQFKDWLDFVYQAIQPNLTELEAREVTRAIANTCPNAAKFFDEENNLDQWTQEALDS